MLQMLAEIRQQPAVLEKTIQTEEPRIARIGKLIQDRDINVVILVARGSSDNAAIFGRYLIEMQTGIPVSLAAPSVYTLYKSKMKLERALVIGVSQSGEGSDINEVLETANEFGALTIGITNNADSSIANIAVETLQIHAGIEKSVAATKTYTGQMLHFYMLVNAMLPESARIDIRKIPDYSEQALKTESQIEELAQRYLFMENCVVVGRGLNYGNSFELALKLMETCYVVAERFSSADFFHGPLAIIERRFPVIMFSPKGVTQKLNLRLLDQLNNLNADSFVITNDPIIANKSTRHMLLEDEIEEALSPIPFIIPGQLFAAHLSTSKGLDPDNPRSLSKVTRTL